MPTPVAPPTRQQFDYASLDSATSDFVQQQTGEIRALMKRTAQGIVAIGQKLIEVKARLGHGRFGGWLEAEFDWSQDTATNFMRVAQRFGDNPKISEFAPSALYLFAAPSTPETAIDEALARAKAGEPITHKTAVSIKQKYTARATKPQAKTKPEPELEPQPEPKPTSPPPTLTPTPSTQSGSKKLEIVAIRPPSQAANASTTANQAVTLPITNSATVTQPTPSVSAPNVLGVWWQLGRHLLYCGDPNSSEFLGRIREQVSLLFAFPIIPGWLSAIPAKTRIVMDEPLSQGRNLAQLDEFLELSVLFNSQLGDLVISCFLPEPEIISIVNRFDRKGMFAEPDFKRVNAIITDWKKAGLKTERLS